MHDDDNELPHIERATTSGILEFFAEAETLMPRKYATTPENAWLLDRLFPSRRTPPVPQDSEPLNP